VTFKAIHILQAFANAIFHAAFDKISTVSVARPICDALEKCLFILYMLKNVQQCTCHAVAICVWVGVWCAVHMSWHVWPPTRHN